MTFYETLKNNRNERYVGVLKLLLKFRSEMAWEDLNKSLMLEFKEFILKKALKKDGKHYNPNYFKFCYSCIKTVVRNERPELLSKIVGMKIPKQPTENIYLSQEELKKIEAVSLNCFQNIVRVRFLIGAYTGARYSDYKNISFDNIQNGSLKYMAQKTSKIITVPLCSYVAERLKIGIPELDFDKDNSELKYFNDTIKEICLKAGINSKDIYFKKDGDNVVKKVLPKWAKVSSHTARRSFATNLALEGVNLRYIQGLLGHSSVVTTENYVLCDTKNFEEMYKGLEYFK